MGVILPLIALLSAAAEPTPAPKPAPLRLNDLSVVGTHNSYKLAMPAETMAKVRAFSTAIADTLDYAHRPLTEQPLDAGARQLEIDVNYDPKGGHYARGSNDPKLQRPGFKVLHMPGIDNSSSCVLLTECLRRDPALVGQAPRPCADHADVQRQGREECLARRHRRPALRYGRLGCARYRNPVGDARRKSWSCLTTYKAAIRHCAMQSARTIGRP